MPPTERIEGSITSFALAHSFVGDPNLLVQSLRSRRRLAHAVTANGCLDGEQGGRRTCSCIFLIASTAEGLPFAAPVPTDQTLNASSSFALTLLASWPRPARLDDNLLARWPSEGRPPDAPRSKSLAFGESGVGV